MLSTVPVVHQAWHKFAPFQVFDDHTPMGGFRLVMQVAPVAAPLDRAVEARATASTPLDPDLASLSIRAGLGLIRSGVASFVYATPDEVMLLVNPEACSGAGASMAVHDRLVSSFSARLSLLSGHELPATGRIYEFPDLDVARKAFRTVQDAVVTGVLRRAVVRLATQLRARNETFDPTMLDSPDEQAELLRTNGVQLEELPPWWVGGVAARARGDGSVEVFDDLPVGDAFATLVLDPS